MHSEKQDVIPSSSLRSKPCLSFAKKLPAFLNESPQKYHTHDLYTWFKRSYLLVCMWSSHLVRLYFSIIKKCIPLGLAELLPSSILFAGKQITGSWPLLSFDTLLSAGMSSAPIAFSFLRLSTVSSNSFHFSTVLESWLFDKASNSDRVHSKSMVVNFLPGISVTLPLALEGYFFFLASWLFLTFSLFSIRRFHCQSHTSHYFFCLWLF